MSTKQDKARGGIERKLTTIMSTDVVGFGPPQMRGSAISIVRRVYFPLPFQERNFLRSRG